MGDRSMTVFVKHGTDWQTKEAYVDCSPAIYMHWRGSETWEYLQTAQGLLRNGDTSYSAARFCGYCHTQIDGNLGLGIMDAPDADTLKSARKLVKWAGCDNGVFVVDVDTWIVTQAVYNAASFKTVGRLTFREDRYE